MGRPLAKSRGNFVALVAGHQVTLFFVAAVLISWTIWLLSPVLSAGDSNAKLVITLIGAYGPSLAAIFVSSILNGKR